MFNGSATEGPGRTPRRGLDNPTVGIGCNGVSPDLWTRLLGEKLIYAPSNPFRIVRCPTMSDMRGGSICGIALFLSEFLLWHGTCDVIRKRIKD